MAGMQLIKLLIFLYLGPAARLLVPCQSLFLSEKTGARLHPALPHTYTRTRTNTRTYVRGAVFPGLDANRPSMFKVYARDT